MSRELNRRAFLGGVAGAGALAVTGLAISSSAEAATLPVLKVGSSGASVKLLQTQLSASGFWLGTADGSFGALTQQAVYAVQKAHGLTRDGVVGPMTWAAVQSRTRFKSRSTTDGIEIDKGRQLLSVVRGGIAQFTFNTSTGSGAKFQLGGKTVTAVTPSGTFKFWWRYPGSGWQNGTLGQIWRPVYFNGDIAVHGSLSIPPYPASHGCARLSTQAQDFLLSRNYLPIGGQVRVY